MTGKGKGNCWMGSMMPLAQASRMDTLAKRFDSRSEAGMPLEPVNKISLIDHRNLLMLTYDI